MRIHWQLMLLPLLAAAGEPLLAQQRQISIRVRAIQKAPPPEPQPGDVVRLDEEGNYIFEGRAASGEIMQYRLVTRKKIKPEIRTEIEAIPGGVRYTYNVANGSDALQPIERFLLPATRPESLTNATAPPQWYAPTPFREPPQPGNRYGCVADVDGGNKGIAPGQSAGPFVLNTRALPGIVQALFRGHISAKDAIIEVDNWKLSPWLLDRLHELTTIEAESLPLPVVAPKYPTSELDDSRKLASAIAAELRGAATMAEFQQFQPFLQDTASYIETSGKAAAGLDRQLAALGTTPLQRAFFRGMALSLQHLAQLP
jgi:hypothetical protein